MNLFDKITMPVGIIYNISAQNGCKIQGNACVEKISKDNPELVSKKT